MSEECIQVIKMVSEQWRDDVWRPTCSFKLTTGQVRKGQVMTGQVKTDHVRTGQVRTGPVRAGQLRKVKSS